MSSPVALKRPKAVRRAVVLELFTVAWNVVEGAVALAAAKAAGSIALVAFGVDSFVESASGSVMLWRLLAEARAKDAHAIQAIERRARRLIALSLFALAAYVAADACSALWARERPRPSPLGIVVTMVSMVVMMWLARAKRQSAAALGSRAMLTDAFQTTACWWLSLITLVGIGLNATFGWWWADPVTALAMVPLVVREARAAWRGEDCCQDSAGACHDS